MGMYAKLMSRITESSLMDEEILVRYTFMMLLAIADPQGYVVGTDVAIARRLNMPLEEFKKSVTQLMEPDANSNSMEHEGRRVITSDCERGYFLVNYVKYRDTRDEEQRREYMRDYMRKYRGGKDVTPVNKRKHRKPALAKEEVKADVEEKEESLRGFSVPSNLDVPQFRKAWNDFWNYRKSIKKPIRPESVETKLAELSEYGPETSIKAIQQSIGNGWQGIFPDRIAANANTQRPTAANTRTSDTLNSDPNRYAGTGLLGGKRHQVPVQVPSIGPNAAGNA